MSVADRLKDKSLYRTASFIDGSWVQGEGATRIVNPANNETIAELGDVGADGARAAVAAAATAFKTWKTVSPFERSRLLMRWHQLILENAEDLATLITLEMGKTQREAMGEVVYGASFIEWSAEEAKRIHGETMQPPFPKSSG